MSFPGHFLQESRGAAGSIARGGERAARGAASSPWLDRAARLGFVGRGVLYLVVGALAVMAAAGMGGGLTDQRGALSAIAHKPFGGVMVALMGVGFVGMSVWHVVRAAFDPDRRGKGPKGVAIRAGYAGIALLYASLSVLAFRLLAGGGGGQPGQQQKQELTAEILTWPMGRWLVGLAGLVIVGIGVGQLYWAYKQRFMKQLDLRSASDRARRLITRAGQAGYAARGVVFAIAGAFVVSSAVHVDPHEVKGLDGALRELSSRPYGPWLLGASALGLVCFGAFSLAAARYRKIALPDGNGAPPTRRSLAPVAGLGPGAALSRRA